MTPAPHTAINICQQRPAAAAPTRRLQSSNCHRHPALAPAHKLQSAQAQTFGRHLAAAPAAAPAHRLQLSHCHGHLRAAPCTGTNNHVPQASGPNAHTAKQHPAAPPRSGTAAPKRTSQRHLAGKRCHRHGSNTLQWHQHHGPWSHPQSAWAIHIWQRRPAAACSDTNTCSRCLVCLISYDPG